jgi:glycosyltransferase involved in cell wall biosynthesis
VIGCVARWNAQKDIPNLLAAMSEGKRAGLPFIYVLAGRGLDWQNRELVRRLNDSQCDDIVSLLGERSDIPHLMRAFDLHVLPSCGGEAFPNAVAESMLSATPNVVTDTGDAATIVGDAGWVVQPRDSKGLAHAMRDAFNEYRNNPVEWQQRRMAARARVAERYTFESMAEAYENVWRQAVLKARRSYKRKRQGPDEAVAAIDHHVR